MGTKNTTSTATTQLPGYINDAYKNLIGNAQTTGSTPYTPYTGGFTPDQQTAFQNIGSLWGASAPAFGAANDAYSTAMTPTYSSVGQYMSPYMDQVVSSAMANMQEQNAQQQQGVIGDAITKGALGGNRVGVAQAELARQQKLADNQAIANLYQSGYGTALGAAQADKQAALGAGQGYTGLGSTAMQTNLAQAASQLGAGTQQQQFDYQQYLNKLAFPYQQQSWLSSIVGGLGSTAGGTTQQTTPQGNLFSQLLGAGLGVASLFKDGGAVKPHLAVGGVPYANDNGQWPSYGALMGGVPYSNDNGDFGSYVPKVAAFGGGGSRFPTISAPAEQEDYLSRYGSTMKEGASNIKGWLSPSVKEAYNPTTGLPSIFRDGGVVGRRGYATGGRPTADDIAAFYDGIILPGPNGGLVGSPAMPPRVTSPTRGIGGDTVDTVNALNGDNLGLDVNTTLPPRGEDPYIGLGGGDSPYAPLPERPVVPIAGGNRPGEVIYGQGEQFRTNPINDGYSKNAGEALGSFFGGKGFNLAPDAKYGLMNAGFGMMASKSPFFLQGVGEGAMAGSQAWKDYQTMERENAEARAGIGQRGEDLARQAQEAAANIAQTGATTQSIDTGTQANRFDYRYTPFGVQIVDKITGTPGAIYPYGAIMPTGEVATKPEGEQGALFSTTPDQAPLMDARLMTPETAGLVTNETNAALGEAAPAARGAQAGNQMLTEIDHNLSILPEKGLLEPGTKFDDRLELARALNTAITMVGGNPIVDEKEVAAGEDFAKATTRLGYELSNMLGSDNAASIVMNSVASVPNGALSREGNRRVLGSLRAVNQRKIDYYNAMQKWSAQSGGSLLGFDAWFNSANPPELYALSAFVPKEAMEMLVANPKLADAFNEKYGGGKDVARYVLGR